MFSAFIQGRGEYVRLALEDAGATPRSLDGARCGVFVGASANSYAAPTSPSLQTLGGSMAILSARLTDRPIRPLFPKGYRALKPYLRITPPSVPSIG